jgi:hypothetical protein
VNSGPIGSPATYAQHPLINTRQSQSPSSARPTSPDGPARHCDQTPTSHEQFLPGLISRCWAKSRVRSPWRAAFWPSRRPPFSLSFCLPAVFGLRAPCTPPTGHWAPPRRVVSNEAAHARVGGRGRGRGAAQARAWADGDFDADHGLGLDGVGRSAHCLVRAGCAGPTGWTSQFQHHWSSGLSLAVLDS